ncbi:hypothetical protein FRB99_006513 [Tulasnella sp. 403]|nr:hypothetical protein FRB99_006513 [Tulasnella sp. 403]
MSSSAASPSQPSSSSTPLYAQATKNWVIPPRPKVLVDDPLWRTRLILPYQPGRKPKKDAARDDDDDGSEEARKNQNRASQRAFRERRQDQLASLQARIQQYEQGETERYIQLQAVGKRLKEENDQLRAENTKLKEELTKLQAEKAAHWNSTKSGRTDAELVSPTGTRKRVPSIGFDSSSACAARKRTRLGTPLMSSAMALDEPSPTMAARQHIRQISPAVAGGVFPPGSPLISGSSHSAGAPTPTTTSGTTPSSHEVSSPESMVPSFQPAPAPHSSSKSSILSTSLSIMDEPLIPQIRHLVMPNCGFCSDGTVCICRAIERQGASSEDVINIIETFGTTTLQPISPEQPVASSSILDNPPPYQPPVPLRRRQAPSTSSAPLFPIQTGTGNSEASGSGEAIAPTLPPVSAVVCSGDPSNCPVCRDDSFGQAFCSALSACASGRCVNCRKRQEAQQTQQLMSKPTTMQPVCGSAPLGPPSTISRSSAWATLKAHPAIQQNSFTNLNLLAEVVARRASCGARSRGRSPAGSTTTGGRDTPDTSMADSPHVDGPADNDMMDDEHCEGGPLIEVPAEGVDDALAILDSHLQESAPKV